MPAPLLAQPLPLSAEIPGPRMGLWRALKHSRQMRRDYLGTLDELHLRFGDISKMGLIVETVVDVFNPELARELLVDHAAQITRWEGVLRQVVQTPEWKADLEKNFWTNDFTVGDAFKQDLEKDYVAMKAVLVEIGLAK
jgi:hypothetical protein